MNMHRKSIVPRSTADILKILCYLAVELLNLKDSMQLMQKNLPVSFANRIGDCKCIYNK
jgi:hypothetical protein